MSVVAALASRLHEVVGADHLLAGEEACRQYAVDGLTPGLVVFPRGPEEAGRIVALCAAHHHALLPWGGGRRMAMGSELRQLDVVMSLARMNQVVEYDPENLVVTVRAGRTLASLQSLLRQDRLFLPLNLPDDSHETVGGVVAANVAGPKRLRYGAARDVLLGIGVVLPSGAYAHFGGKVVKNVSGYDMSKLFIGSYGALGIITEATFRLLPAPERELSLVAGFDSLAAPLSVVARTLDSSLAPASLTLFNRAAAQALVREQLGVLTAHPYVLAVALEGDREAVERELSEVGLLCERAPAIEMGYLESRSHGRLWGAVRDFPTQVREDEVVCLVNVPPGSIGQVIEAAMSQGKTVAPGPRVIAQGGVGAVRVAFPPQDSVGGTVSAARELAEVAVRLGGNFRLERAPLALKRQVYVWGAARPEWRLMARLKAEFDPAGILSPGRFVGGI